MKIILVSCVSQKLNHPAPARELYISDWFKKARAYAENEIAEGRASQWFILSAKHGALLPCNVVAPYDTDLSSMHNHLRRDWALKALKQIWWLGLKGEIEVEILAGVRYREFLIGDLERRYSRVTVPMAGMGIGQQKQWLKRQVEGQ
jgi:hypothetical protein